MFAFVNRDRGREAVKTQRRRNAAAAVAAYEARAAKPKWVPEHLKSKSRDDFSKDEKRIYMKAKRRNQKLKELGFTPSYITEIMRMI